MRSTLLALVAAALVAIAVAPAGARAATCTQSHLPLQDPNCQIGTTNPDVSQDNIGSTICVSGWTRTIRPPAEYTSSLKLEQMREYGLDGSTSGYQEDHLVSLELGGHPTDRRNLWPEPLPHAADVDRVENELNRKVCAGQITLAEGQRRETELKHRSG